MLLATNCQCLAKTWLCLERHNGNIKKPGCKPGYFFCRFLNIYCLLQYVKVIIIIAVIIVLLTKVQSIKFLTRNGGSEMDKSVLWKISYGMYALTVMDGERPTGCIINTAVQVTSDNPTIAISVNKNNYTFTALEKSGKFALTILSEATPQNVIARLGFCSGCDTDKFEACGFSWEMKNGLPVITDKTSGYITAEVLGKYEMETHFVILARVVDAEVLGDYTPMTYKYYHDVIKGKAPKNAPTYQEETVKPAGEKWVCTICGYVYEGDLTKEPDDFTCPICRQPKSRFKKVE